ncbi:putative integrase [Enterobacter hormaechei]|nr:putative integrase [Enterobacter hormaechei]
MTVMHQKIRSFFRRLSKECGFAVSPHRFRHTLATELMKAPERNLQLVKDLLGHRSVSTTMEYVELNMDIVGKTLEEELSLHTDLCVERELQLLTQN